MRFLVEVAAVLTVSVIDPVVIVPVIVAAFWRRWWLPLVIGALAGLASHLLSEQMGGLPADYLLVPKIIAGALLGGIVAALAPLIRWMRGSPLKQPRFQSPAGPPEAKGQSANWPRIKGWQKPTPAPAPAPAPAPDEGYGPEI